MTPQETMLVQESFELLAPISRAAAYLFYDRLFELDPTLRPLFTGDIHEQGRKLMQIIAVAVNGIDQLDPLVPALQDLGRAHVRYGVVVEHYATVGAALLWTLERCLGEQFTPDVREAWAEAYAILATTMLSAVEVAA
jgi:hemoglobin-like flavoprotein